MTHSDLPPYTFIRIPLGPILFKLGVPPESLEASSSSDILCPLMPNKDQETGLICYYPSLARSYGLLAANQADISLFYIFGHQRAAS